MIEHEVLQASRNNVPLLLRPHPHTCTKAQDTTICLKDESAEDLFQTNANVLRLTLPSDGFNKYSHPHGGTRT